jgi:hypothetical protein
MKTSVSGSNVKESQNKADRSIAYLLTAILCLFAPSHITSPPAVAADNCNTIKKEVIRLESLVRSDQKSFLRFEGMKIQGTIGVQFERSAKNQYLKKLGKVTYNNQSCFTKSQYDQILRKRYWMTPYTISFRSISTAKGLECKNNPSTRKEIDLGIYEPKNSTPGVVCDVPTYLIVDMKNWLYGASIYSY